MRIAILGAGITGLTIGYQLARRAPEWDFVLFERSDRVGGLLKSEQRAGFTWDTAGGHILYTRDPALRRHLWDRLGGAVVESRRQTRIYYHGRYVNYPFENGLGDLSPEDNFRCLRGYVNAYLAREKGTAPRPSSLREWIYWRFGDGIAESFMIPYNEKIWKSDLRDMSFDWVADRVPDAPPDDVIRSAVGIRTEGYTHQLQFGYPLRGGMQALADATAAPIRDRIRLATPVAHVRGRAGRWEVNGDRFDRVVSTLPLRGVPDLLDGMDPAAAAAARALEYVHVLCFLVGLDHPGRVPYSWVYLPHPENGPVNRLTHLGNYSPGNCPAGHSSVMCEVTFRGDRPPDPEATLAALLARLEEAEVLDRRRVAATAWSRADHAYAYHGRDFPANIARVRAYLDGIGFDTCGRTGRMEYFNTDHCVAAAFAYVERLVATGRPGR
ncbi:MAG: FAD-dependent oxidoreductase [Planctomycetes bacterium]|nr:FAD-dependent oxidoreductase [Planctomycetota bacterium]